MGTCGYGQEAAKTINEIKPSGAPDSIPFEGLAVIKEQKDNNVCKIIKENNLTGTGFLCIIPFPDKLHPLPVLMTCNHVFNDEDIKPGKQIKLIFKDKIEKILNIDNSRITYTSKEDEFDTTIIEIKNEDNFDINNMLEIDNNIYKDDLNEYYKNKTIYIIHYPNGLNSSYSHHIIKYIKNNKIFHACATDFGSSGAPILNLQNFKVMGIHNGSVGNFNKGIVMKEPIDGFNKAILSLKQKKEKELNLFRKGIEKNEISLSLKVCKKDIAKKVHFLFNSDSIEEEVDILNELNDSNTKLFINDKEYKFEKYFEPEKEGIYKIKLIFNFYMTNCNYMFYNCRNILDLDLSSFCTKEVTSMLGMFFGCSSLTFIDLTGFNTSKVKTMKRMFSCCNSLQKIDLSSFDTRNVENMYEMFHSCLEITELDLSSFNPANLREINGMFWNCSNLTNINFSSFNAPNVRATRYLFAYCSSLVKLDLSSFYTAKIADFVSMFQNCYSLTELDLSNFETENVDLTIILQAMLTTFNSCSKLSKIKIKKDTYESLKRILPKKAEIIFV